MTFWQWSRDRTDRLRPPVRFLAAAQCIVGQSLVSKDPDSSRLPLYHRRSLLRRGQMILVKAPPRSSVQCWTTDWRQLETWAPCTMTAAIMAHTCRLRDKGSTLRMTRRREGKDCQQVSSTRLSVARSLTEAGYATDTAL